uniref:SAP domain-containing protein n=1 Tax=Macrostomum lignano TaxID=282301 RepID=A0A1I8FB30_9PLAT
MAEAFAEAAELAAVEAKSATAEAAAAASAENSVAEPAQRMPVAKRMTGSNLDALKARLIGRGYLPPGASDEELARLVRNLIDVYSRRRLLLKVLRLQSKETAVN